MSKAQDALIYDLEFLKKEYSKVLNRGDICKPAIMTEFHKNIISTSYNVLGFYRTFAETPRKIPLKLYEKVDSFFNDPVIDLHEYLQDENMAGIELSLGRILGNGDNSKLTALIEQVINFG